MSISLIILPCSFVVLLMLSALFSGSETVLFSFSPIQLQRLRERRPALAFRLETLLSNPSKILSTLLISNTLVNFCAAWIGYRFLCLITPDYAEVVSIPIVTLLLLFFAEVTPKRLALSHPEKLLPKILPLIAATETLLRPLTHLLQVPSNAKKTIFRPERKTIDDEELMTLIEVSEEEGYLDPEERSMVDGIIRLSELKASDVMTPRVDIIGVDLDLPFEQQDAVIRKNRFHVLPVYKRTPDAIEGFVDTVSYLLMEKPDVKAAMSPVLFVPENVSLDDLLVSFQRSRRYIACVLDEYGGTAGIITRGDILELVVDPVVESNPTPPEMIPVSENVWLVDGRASLEEVNYELNLNLDADDSDRISGWVTYHAGLIPHPGYTFTAQNCRCTVRKLRHRSIEQVQIEVLAESNAESEMDE